MPPDTARPQELHPRPDTPRPVEQAVVTEVFRNSRRDGLCIGTSEGRGNGAFPANPFLWEPLRKLDHGPAKRRSGNLSAQIVQVNFRVPCLAGLSVSPMTLRVLYRRSAGHYARKRRFGALVRLIVENCRW